MLLSDNEYLYLSEEKNKLRLTFTQFQLVLQIISFYNHSGSHPHALYQVHNLSHGVMSDDSKNIRRKECWFMLQTLSSSHRNKCFMRVFKNQVDDQKTNGFLKVCWVDDGLLKTQTYF